MIITVASGKGGTGKTTVAVNLAKVLAQKNEKVFYFDCDVEEPNGHIFLKPVIEEKELAFTFVPKIDKEKCIFCGKCADVCQFNAIFALKDTVMVFPELCHGCKGCQLICPVGAVVSDKKEIGIVEKGKAGKINFIHGKLRIGEAMAPPLIREVKKYINKEEITIIDAPPGTSCPVIETIVLSDYVILVTEPTPFGLHDLKLAVEVMRVLKLPCGVVINRCDVGEKKVEQYCKEENIPVLLEIPHDRRIAESYSRGEIIIEAIPEYRDFFENLYKRITNL